MTCKNCIYESMCHNVIAYGMDTDDVTGKLITDIEKYCKHFKDKSRFIIPPCKVGDTVYQIDTAGNIYESKILKTIYDTNGIAFDERAIGKSIFLTREEAEQALAEREGKDGK